MSAFNPFANTSTTSTKPPNPFAKPTPAPAFGVAPAFGGAKPPTGVFAAPGTHPKAAPTFGPPPTGQTGFTTGQTGATRGRGGFNVNAAPFKPQGRGGQNNAQGRGGFGGQVGQGGFQQQGQRGGFNKTSPGMNGVKRGAPMGMQGQVGRGRGGGPGRGGFQGRGGFVQPAGGFQQQNGGFQQQGQNGFPQQPAGGFQQPNGFQTQNTFQQQNSFQQQPPQNLFPQQNAFQTQQQNLPQGNGFQTQAPGGFGKPQGFQQPQQQQFGAPASSNADVNHFDDNDVLDVLKTTKGRDLKGTFDAMQTRRAAERKRSIAAGLIDDPDNPKPLHMAIEFNGTCHNKCPSHEIIERCYQNMVDSLELDENGIPDATRFVKRFHRPAAGVENPLPRDVRTPQALKATMEYLVIEVLQNNPLESAHGFVRDRTRGVRQDFVYQNYRLDEAIYCHETIARFHILALHHMAGHQNFDAFQEMEQLRKTLTSLAEYYRDAAREGRSYPNEAEFRAYSVILLARERDVERLVSEWPKRVRDSEEVTLAVQFYEMLQRNSEAPRVKRTGRPEVVHNTPITFFNLIRSEKTPYLMACLLEYHFGDVRRSGLNFMNRGYNVRAKRLTLPLIQRWLGYESVEDAREDIDNHGFTIVEDPQFGEYLLPTKGITAERQSSGSDQKFHQQLVENKRGGRSLAEVLLRERQESYIEPLPPTDNTNRAVWKLTPLEGQQLDFSELLDQNEIQQLTPVVMNTQVSDNQRVAPVDHGDFGMSALKAVKRSSEEKEKDMLRKVQAARKAATAPAPKAAPVGFGQPVQKSPFGSPAAPQTNTPTPAPNPFFAAPATNNTPPTPAPAFAPPQQPAAPTPFQGFKAPEAAPTFTPPSSQTTTTASPSFTATTLNTSINSKAEKPVSSWFPSSAVEGGAPSTTGGASVFSKPAVSTSAPASSGSPAASIFSKPAEAPAASIFSKPAEPSSGPAAPLFSAPPAPSAPTPAFNPPASKPAFTGAPLFSAPPTTQEKPNFESKGTDPMTPMKPPNMGFNFKSPGAKGKTPEKEEKPAEPPRAPTPEPKETEEQIREREDRAREEEIKERKRRRLLEYTFYTWLHQIQRIRRLRMAAEKKKKANKPIASQWWPIARDMVPAQKIQHCSERVFKPADTEVWFPEIVEHALQTIGARNRSWKLILHNGDWSGESRYWWHQKFLRGQESISIPLGSGNSFQALTTVSESDLQSVGALIYGCSPDFSYSSEVRYNHDRKHLHQMIDVLTKNTQYSRLVVMVLAYRSPLDNNPANPLAADFTRTMGEARNQRVETVKSALGFNEFPHEVVCKDVIMLETVRDMELSPALRSIAEKFVLATVNPVYADELNAPTSMPPPAEIPKPRSMPALSHQPKQSSPLAGSPGGSPPPPGRGFAAPKRSNRGSGFIAKLRAQGSRSPSLSSTPPPTTARKRQLPTSTPQTKRARQAPNPITPQPELEQVSKAQQYKLLGLHLPRQQLRSAVEREEENIERKGRRKMETERKRRELEELVRGIEESVGEVRSFVEEVDSQSGVGGVGEWDDGEGVWSVGEGSWLGDLAGP